MAPLRIRRGARGRSRPWPPTIAAPLAAALLLAASCTGGGARGSASPEEVGVGLFPNLTHAPAILCVAGGYFDKYLDTGDGRARRVGVKLFDSGPQAVEAIYSGSIDFAYVGPSPALNGFLRSGGEALRIVAGAASGGASFVVQPHITSTADLSGTVLATPQLGNTQDIALRAWLAANGIRTDIRRSGDATIAPRPNSKIFDGFRLGLIAGAWVPEPWASRLVVEAGGRVMVDERDLWPRGLFSTTVVVATPRFIERDPAGLQAVLRAHLDCIGRLTSKDPAIVREARNTVGEWIVGQTGRALPDEVVERAWGELSFTSDPLLDTIVERGRQAATMGLLLTFDDAQIAELFDGGPLEQAEQRKSTVAEAR